MDKGVLMQGGVLTGARKKIMQPTFHLFFQLFVYYFIYLFGCENVAGILQVEDTKVNDIIFINAFNRA